MFKSLFKRETAGRQEGPSALERLRRVFDEALVRIQTTALEAQAEGSPAWDALLREHGIEPGTRAERLELSQGGFAQRCGAPMPEVKEALKALEESTLQRWWGIETGPGEDLEEARQHVMRCVREAGDSYAAQVKPLVQMSNVFANALLSSQQHLSKIGAPRHITVRCRTCGSPRAEDSETTCRYCGHPLYETGSGK